MPSRNDQSPHFNLSESRDMNLIRKPFFIAILLAAALAGTLSATMAWAADTSAAQQLSRWSNEAGAPGNAEQGRAFFNSTHGGDWSCASCHGQPPTAQGKHASTGKAIAPLAPAFDARRFTETAKVDKWFRRNCKDVLSRECTPVEKADVLAYLISLKP
jgi:hypothetical protein